jgi:hypothetical protein
MLSCGIVATTMTKGSGLQWATMPNVVMGWVLTASRHHVIGDALSGIQPGFLERTAGASAFAVRRDEWGLAPVRDFLRP